MPTLVFDLDSRQARIAAMAGETILEASSRAAGLLIDAPCGGRGRCGKCLVIASGALVAPAEDEASALAALPGASSPGLRLACLARIADGPDEATVLVRPASGLPGATSAVAGAASIVVHGPEGDGHLDPPVAELLIEVKAPVLGDRRSDLDRVLEALALREPEIGDPAPTRAFLSALPAALRQGGDSARQSVAVLRSPGALLGVRPGASRRPGRTIAAAVDLGTTTVVVQLLDLATGLTLGVESAMNVQRSAGADVISRIQHCAERADGLQSLATRTVGQLEAMIRGLCERGGESLESVVAIAVAGNTTMLQLLAGVDPSPIAAAPFSPAFTGRLELQAAEAGFGLPPTARLILLPGVSAYVGADIVAGLVACGLDRREGDWLFLDLGTNGEIALGGAEGLLCCATAAGPAFEGAHIERGSASVAGAINSVELGGAGIKSGTIAGAPPMGICGSGIVDAVSVLLRTGAVDETGRLLDPGEMPPMARKLFTRDETGPDAQGRAYLDPDGAVWLSQKDIREIQLAAAATAAGVDVLLDRRGIGARGLAGVVLAGGFGSRLDPESAMDLGLFPAPGSGVVESVGNASAAGAARAALSRRDLARMEAAARRMEYVELSSSPRFMDAYMERMVFPARTRGSGV